MAKRSAIIKGERKVAAPKAEAPKRESRPSSGPSAIVSGPRTPSDRPAAAPASKPSPPEVWDVRKFAELDAKIAAAAGGGGGGGGPHTHPIGDITGLTAALDGKADDSEITAINAALAGKANTSHSHAQADVTGLTAALAGKSDTGHGHAQSDISGLTAALAGKSNTGHGHAIAEVSGLTAALDGKADDSEITAINSALAGKANTSHSHAQADVTGLTAALAAKSDTGHGHAQSDITGLTAALAGKSDTSHSHSNATTSTPGFVPAPGTATGRYLKDDLTWATPAGGGGGGGTPDPVKLRPYAAELPASAFPKLDRVNGRPVLSFLNTTAQDAFWTDVAPQGSWTSVTLHIYCICAVASGGIRWEAALEAITDGDAMDLDSSDSFAALNGASIASVPATAGHLRVLAITLTNADSIAPGDYFRLRLTRAVAHADDTAEGLAHFLIGELRWA